VLLVHVIEHFNSPCRALQRIHGLLKPGGRLYVECPNFAAPFAFRNRMLHYAHIYNFTPWTLAAMAMRCGFRVQEWFVPERSINLVLLLVRADFPRLEIDPLGYRRTIEAFGRHNLFTYHLRPSHLWHELKRVAGQLRERFLAPRFVEDLSARLTDASQARPASEPALSAQEPLRRAA
jgi:SAM-dependent methyltransferase